MGSLLLVGTATDGPNYLTRWVDSTDDILKLFGGVYLQRATITPTQTSLTLTYNTLNRPLDFINNKSGQMYLTNLASPPSNALTFGRIGGATNTTVDFRYEPYLGDTDLCWMIRRYQSYTSGGYAVRLGGVQASLISGNWKFVGKFAGTKYNLVNINANGSNSLTVSGLAPEYTSKTYTGTAQDIVDQIKYDLMMGISCIDVETWDNTLPNINTTLTSGSNGTLTEQEILTGLSMADIPLDVSHIYLPCLLSQALVSACATLEANLGRNLIWIVPTVTTTPVLTWINNLITTIPSRLDTMIVVPGTVESQQGQSVTRWAAEEVAMSLGTSTFNLTNTKIPVRNFAPAYSKQDLDYLTNAGFTCLTRHIMSDVSIYQGVTSSRYTSFFKQFITALGISRISLYMNQFIGTPQEEGRNNIMEDGVRKALSDINFFDIDSVEVNVGLRTITVDVTGTIPNEILTISFIVGT